MWIVTIVGFAIVALAHVVPGRFVLDAMAGDRAVWHMPRDSPPTIYLTYDDGPNPTTTPDLLDVLAREEAYATFFLIYRHVTEETAASTSSDAQGTGVIMPSTSMVHTAPASHPPEMTPLPSSTTLPGGICAASCSTVRVIARSDSTSTKGIL